MMDAHWDASLDKQGCHQEGGWKEKFYMGLSRRHSRHRLPRVWLALMWPRAGPVTG